ncbi:MAG: glycosyl transferase family 28, partial [Chitinophagaceae bacterium]
MNGKIINNLRKEPVILVAPLDWGLGHATRCIPIIYTLIRNGARVLLAGEAATEQLYRKEFPTLTFLPLKGYRVQYARKKQHFNLKLLSQLPRLQRLISYEHRWLKKVVAEHNIDAVISDNRPGLYHPHIPCVYITHQLFIETGSSWLTALAQKIHYSFINRFTECWVPDVAGSNSLAGKLSHPKKLPLVPVLYVGCLSRFTQGVQEKSTRLLVLLSGPEPMRSIFEKLI